MNAASPTTPRVLVLAVLLGWLAPRETRAENAISYKYEDYRETGGRIAVKTQGALAEQDINLSTHIKVEGVLDAIAGATPNGMPAPAGSDQVPLSGPSLGLRLETSHSKSYAALFHPLAMLVGRGASDMVMSEMALRTSFRNLR